VAAGAPDQRPGLEDAPLTATYPPYRGAEGAARSLVRRGSRHTVAATTRA